MALQFDFDISCPGLPPNNPAAGRPAQHCRVLLLVEIIRAKSRHLWDLKIAKRNFGEPVWKRNGLRCKHRVGRRRRAAAVMQLARQAAGGGATATATAAATARLPGRKGGTGIDVRRRRALRPFSLNTAFRFFLFSEKIGKLVHEKLRLEFAQTLCGKKSQQLGATRTPRIVATLLHCTVNMHFPSGVETRVLGVLSVLRSTYISRGPQPPQVVVVTLRDHAALA